MSGFNENKKFGFLPSGNSIKLIIVVLLHHAVVIMNIIAFVLLPFLTPWYIACPLMTWIAMLSTTRVLDCPLTIYENKLREELGKQQIKGFIRHYILKPYIKTKRKIL